MCEQRYTRQLEEEKKRLQQQFSERKSLLADKMKIECDSQMQELESRLKQ